MPNRRVARILSKLKVFRMRIKTLGLATKQSFRLKIWRIQKKSKDLKILLDMDAIDGKFELSNENDIDSTPVFRLRNQNPKLEIKIATEKPMQTEATTNKAKIISIPNSEKLLSKIVAQLGNSPAQLTGDSLLASDF